MNESRSSVIIDAPAGAVFKALTDPDLVKQWQYRKQIITGWQPGDEINFVSHDEQIRQKGKITAFKENETISYELSTPVSSGIIYSITTYLLSPEGKGTRIELRQSDDRPSSFQPPDLMPVLRALKSVVERQTG